MKRYVWFAVLCFWTLSSIAQTFKGRVTDEKGEAVPYERPIGVRIASTMTTCSIVTP